MREEPSTGPLPSCVPGDQDPTDARDHDLRCTNADRPPRPTDVPHHGSAQPGDDVNVMGRVTVGPIGIPRSELGEVLGIEKLPQPRQVIRVQTILGKRVDVDAAAQTSVTCPASTRQCRSVFTVASIRRSWVTSNRVPS